MDIPCQDFFVMFKSDSKEGIFIVYPFIGEEPYEIDLIRAEKEIWRKLSSHLPPNYTETFTAQDVFNDREFQEKLLLLELRAEIMPLSAFDNSDYN